MRIATKPKLIDAETLSKWSVHPLAASYPRMSSQELESLAKSIEQDGQLEPILIYQKTIIDGLNRLAAVRSLGRDARIRRIEDATEVEIANYIAAKNVHRRHMTASAWAQVALAYRDHLDGKISDEDLAKKFNISRGTIAGAKRDASNSKEAKTPLPPGPIIQLRKSLSQVSGLPEGKTRSRAIDEVRRCEEILRELIAARPS